MNYELQLTSSNPYSFSTLNGAQPPLVAGSGSATLMTAVSPGYDFPLFKAGYENYAFSLEVWWLPVSGSGNVIGHGIEGVLWNGTEFILRVNNADGGSVQANWTPPEISAFHVVMTYTPGSARLYVNGSLVASIDLAGVKFIAASDWKIVLNEAHTGIYDSLALYTRALTGSEILEHYTWAKSVRSPVQVATANGGYTWNLMHSESDIYATERFDAANWDLFFLNGVGVLGGRLTANEGGGTWMGMVPLSTMVNGITPGVSLTYTGFGVVLSYSLDNVTWTPVANGAVILEDVDVTNVNLLLRIDLPDDGWVEQLSVAIINDRVLSPASGNLNLTFKGAEMDYESPQPLDFSRSWGANLNGYLVIPAVDTQVTGTTELWVKVNQSGTAFTLLDGQTPQGAGTSWVSVTAGGAIAPGGGGQVYVNGVARSTGYILPVGVWNHVVLVEPAPVTFSSFIGRPRGGVENSKITVGHVALYPTSMTSSQVASLYAQNVGSPILRIDDASGVTVTEQATPVAFYAQNWSFVSSGS